MTTSGGNPWAMCYRKVAAPEQLAALARRAGNVLHGLEKLAVEDACLRIETEWMRLYVPSAQDCKIMSRLIASSLAYAEAAYPDRTTVLQRFYSESMDLAPVIPMCLTGPTGAGKSCLASAVGRILSGRSMAVVDADHSPFPVVPFRSVTIKSTQGIHAVLSALAGVELPKLCMVPACTSRIYRSGGSMLLVDEMQFLTQSAAANVAISKMLLSVSYLGIPCAYIANYSLCYRLQRAPPETRQRLLTNPCVLVPDAPDAADWKLLLNELQALVPGVYVFDFTSKAIELWNLTAGLRRSLRELLIKAYRHAREAGQQTVSWGMVETTYHSLAYAVTRGDVEQLIAHALTGKRIRQELVCPFEGADRVYREGLRAARRAQVSSAVNAEALTKNERDAIKAIQSEAVRSPAQPAGPSAPTAAKTAATTAAPARSRRALSAVALIDNAARLLNEKAPRDRRAGPGGR